MSKFCAGILAGTNKHRLRIAEEIAEAIEMMDAHVQKRQPAIIFQPICQ